MIINKANLILLFIYFNTFNVLSQNEIIFTSHQMLLPNNSLVYINKYDGEILIIKILYAKEKIKNNILNISSKDIGKIKNMITKKDQNHKCVHYLLSYYNLNTHEPKNILIREDLVTNYKTKKFTLINFEELKFNENTFYCENAKDESFTYRFVFFREYFKKNIDLLINKNFELYLYEHDCNNIFIDEINAFDKFYYDKEIFISRNDKSIYFLY
jgi:hypothetical protein